VGKVLTTDLEIEAALERARNAPDPLAAVEAKYDHASNVLLVRLNTGRRLAIPREDMQGLRDASPEDVAEIEILGSGVGLHWEKLNVDFSVDGLANGRYGSRKWMQSLPAHKESA
jgi:hypothetical protein